jgi:hypothetical protein
MNWLKFLSDFNFSILNKPIFLIIKKLEKQLKDIAYGTKQIKIDHESEFFPLSVQEKLGKNRGIFSYVGSPAHDNLDHQLIVNLERGQNVFEIHLTKVRILLILIFFLV